VAGQAPGGLSARSAEAGRLGRNRAGGPGSSGRGPIGAGCNDGARSSSGGLLWNRRPRAWRGYPQTSGPAPAGSRFSALGLVARRQRRTITPAGWTSLARSLARSASPGPSRTEQPCHTLCWSCRDLRSSGISGHCPHGRIELAGGRCTPWKESVHNRYAGRPEPMVWRPSGEI
jgi:hypothetical protein